MAHAGHAMARPRPPLMMCHHLRALDLGHLGERNQPQTAPQAPQKVGWFSTESLQRIRGCPSKPWRKLGFRCWTLGCKDRSHDMWSVNDLCNHLHGGWKGYWWEHSMGHINDNQKLDYTAIPFIGINHNKPCAIFRPWHIQEWYMMMMMMMMMMMTYYDDMLLYIDHN